MNRLSSSAATSVLYGVTALIVGAAPACTQPPDEDGPSGVLSGDSDLTGTREGRETGSAFATAGASYYPSRSLAVLGRLGALDDDVGATLRRADGIIAAQPADGRVTIEELVRLERPDFERVLLPEEKAGRKKAWSLFEAPRNTPPTYLPPLGPFEPIKAKKIFVGAIDKKKALPRSEISTDIALLRLEQAYDNDGDRNTVSMLDCEQAIAAPAPFTPAEIGTIKAARDAIARRLEAPREARLDVEAPWAESKALPSFAGVSLTHRRYVEYVETRRPGEILSISIHARRVSYVEVAPPAGVTIVVVRPSQSPVYEGIEGTAVGSKRWTVGGSELALEVWKDGSRLGAMALAATERDVAEDLSDYFDIPFFAEGSTLAKNAVQGGDRVEFRYEKSAAPPSGGATSSVVDAVASPKIDLTVLPVGRYPVPQGSTAYGGASESLDIISDTIIFNDWSEWHITQPGTKHEVRRYLPRNVKLGGVMTQTYEGRCAGSARCTLDVAAGKLLLRDDFPYLFFRDYASLSAAARAAE